MVDYIPAPADSGYFGMGSGDKAGRKNPCHRGRHENWNHRSEDGNELLSGGKIMATWEVMVFCLMCGYIGFFLGLRVAEREFKELDNENENNF